MSENVTTGEGSSKVVLAVRATMMLIGFCLALAGAQYITSRFTPDLYAELMAIWGGLWAESPMLVVSLFLLFLMISVLIVLKVLYGYDLPEYNPLKRI